MNTIINSAGKALDRVWLNRYPADVPAEIDPEHYASLAALFDSKVQRFASLTAYIHLGERLSRHSIVHDGPDRRQEIPASNS